MAWFKTSPSLKIIKNIKMNKKIYLLPLVLLFACGEKEPEDVTQTVNKEGAVETQMDIQHIDSQKDVMQIRHKVWAKGNLVKEFVTYDTIPALGEIETTAKDNNGDENDVKVKQDYEIYFTVK
jgi:hypothetical protein